MLCPQSVLQESEKLDSMVILGEDAVCITVYNGYFVSGSILLNRAAGGPWRVGWRSLEKAE